MVKLIFTTVVQCIIIFCYNGVFCIVTLVGYDGIFYIIRIVEYVIVVYFTLITVVAVISSVVTLTSLSIERFLIVMFPMKGRLSKNLLTFLVVFSWVAAIGTSAPNLKVRQKLEIQWRNRKDVWCDEIWPRFYTDTRCNSDQPGRRSYYVFLSVFMYFIPITVMMLAYGLIGVRLFRRQMPGNGVTAVNDVHGNARKKVTL